MKTEEEWPVLEIFFLHDCYANRGEVCFSPFVALPLKAGKSHPYTVGYSAYQKNSFFADIGKFDTA